MDKLDVTQISDPTSQQPLTGKSVDFIQDAFRDSLNAAVRAIVGGHWDTSVVYILNGLEMTGANNDISNGYAFYQSEVFFVTGASNTVAFSNVPVLIPDYPTAHPTLDPILFSDGVNKNVHNIRRLKIVDQVSGSGSSDYADVVFINRRKITQLTGTSTATTGSGQTDVTGISYTSPSTRRTRLKFTLDAQFSFGSNTSIEGPKMILRDVTGAANVKYAIHEAYYSPAAGPTYYASLAFSIIIDDVAPSTNYKMQIQRGTGGANVTAFTSNMIVEEIPD